MRKGLRLVIAIGLVLSAAAFLSAAKEKTAEVWVLTLFRGADPGFVSDSYAERATAFTVASKLEQGPDTWVQVSPSRLHAKKPAKLFSLLLVPMLLAQVNPDAQDGLVLPTIERDGTFESPEVLIPTGATRVGARLDLDALERVNPLLQLQAVIQTKRLDGTWFVRCIVSQDSRVSLPAPGATPSISCGINATWDRSQPVRAAARTCVAGQFDTACFTAPFTVGMTTEFIIPRVP